MFWSCQSNMNIRSSLVSPLTFNATKLMISILLLIKTKDKTINDHTSTVLIILISPVIHYSQVLFVLCVRMCQMFGSVHVA